MGSNNYVSNINMTKQPAKEVRRTEINIKEVNSSSKKNNKSETTCLAEAVQQQLNKDYGYDKK